MSKESKVLGSCTCGAIKFVVTLPVRWCTHCHCEACRRQHAAAFVTWFGVAWESFKLTGREYLKWYICAQDAKRGFCIHCGTQLLFMSTRWPDEVHVTRANLHGKVEINPAYHVHFDQRAGWFPFDDSLPRLYGRDGIKQIDDSAPPAEEHAGTS